MRAMHTTLIRPTELASLVDSPAGVRANVAILDCRHDLARPDWSDHTYSDGHIPGAVQAHLDRDLSSPIGPQTGRHPLPDVAKLAETLGRWGIDNDTQVIAYDQGNGMYAARAWWLLRWMGHSRVAVLDGGFAAWQEAGLPVSRDPGTPIARTFEPHARREAYLTTAEVQQALVDSSISLIDARGADRFGGENETIDPVAGHVPGATNRPFPKNVDGRGRFLAAEELRRQWIETLGTRGAGEVVAMCGSGVSACHNLLALEIAGLPGGRLYAGSWSEWIRDPGRPVARG
jgi:thiosulfate/3-mercaptopyruvate sulfurtransferase